MTQSQALKRLRRSHWIGLEELLKQDLEIRYHPYRCW